MKKIYLSCSLLFSFAVHLHAQNNFPGPVGIGTVNPSSSFSLHVVGASRYDGTGNFGDYYSTTPYGKGIQIGRPANAGDDAFYLSFRRAASRTTGMGFLRNSNTFAIQNSFNNTSSTGIFLSEQGNVGLGIPAPEHALDVNGEIRLSGRRLLLDKYGVIYADNSNIAMFTRGGYVFSNMDNSVTRAVIGSDGSLHLYNGTNVPIRLMTTGNSYINTGNVGIGVTNPTYKLTVDGTVGARKVKVTQETWADFVFDSTYVLPALKDIEAHTKTYKHLPGIPSAKEIAADGLDIGDMQQKQMQKIEELTLYLIEQQKQLTAQQELISALNKRLKDLEDK
jgi:hypothetical protein